MADVPLPPVELRRLVGPLEDHFFTNPTGAPVFGLEPGAYDQVLDWGCGCGRLARQLIQQHPRPKAYLGLDLHRGMVQWCQHHLAPHAPGFEFRHHDVYNAGLNPSGSTAPLPFPIADGTVSLVIAWSVFTHVLEAAAGFYLREVARVLRPGGVAVTTWFLFDKAYFPMMQEFQNALYINDVDPTNAVIFDRRWLRETARAAGLVITQARPPEVRGYQWLLHLQPLAAGLPEAELPADVAAMGVVRPPLMPEGAAGLTTKNPAS
jgi:SAM-dependent methyltransferase